MIQFTKDLLFANWRNKGVALFFALSIWFIAYQSETRQFSTPVRVAVLPADAAGQAVVAVEVGDRGDRFDGELTLTLNGPRKRIDELRNQARRGFSVRVAVPVEEQVHLFQRDDFDFLPPEVAVVSIAPPTVRVRQEALDERIVENLADKILVTDYDADNVVRVEVLEPLAGQLRLRGPKTVLDTLSVQFSVSMQFRRTEIVEQLAPRIRGEPQELVDRVVRVWSDASSRWVEPNQAPRIKVRVTLERSVDSYSVDAVPVVFQLPLTQVACRVVLNDVPPGANTIPVKFTGPKDRIEALRDDQGLSLLVPPPPSFDPQKGGIFTFTEDALRLHGYPRVRIGQHESREKERQNAWSYEVIVVPTEEGN